jgi:hypothetical protein
MICSRSQLQALLTRLPLPQHTSQELLVFLL